VLQEEEEEEREGEEGDVEEEVDAAAAAIAWPWTTVRRGRSPPPPPPPAPPLPRAPSRRRAPQHRHRDTPVPPPPVDTRRPERTPLERMATLAEMADVVDVARDAAAAEFRREVVPHAHLGAAAVPAPGAGGSASASARDCLLCNIGSRQYDTSSSTGSLLFATLVKLIDANLASQGPDAVVGLAERFHQRWIQPAFARAGLPCPVLSTAAVRRHVTTCDHSINPRLALNVMLRTSFEDLAHLQEDKRKARAAGNVDEYVNLLKAQNLTVRSVLDLYARDVNKMAFNAPVDGDLRPDMVAPFAPWMRTTLGGGNGRGDVGPVDDVPSLYRDWMADFFAGRDTDSVPAAPAPAAAPGLIAAHATTT